MSNMNGVVVGLVTQVRPGAVTGGVGLGGRRVERVLGWCSQRVGHAGDDATGQRADVVEGVDLLERADGASIGDLITATAVVPISRPSSST